MRRPRARPQRQPRLGRQRFEVDFEVVPVDGNGVEGGGEDVVEETECRVGIRAVDADEVAQPHDHRRGAVGIATDLRRRFEPEEVRGDGRLRRIVARRVGPHRRIAGDRTEPAPEAIVGVAEDRHRQCGDDGAAL